MAVTFGGKPAASQDKSKSSKATKSADKKPGGFVWYKRGAAALQEIEQEDEKQQQAYEASQRMFRFRIKEDDEARITFIDGNLDEDGLLDAIVYREHHLCINGKWGHYYTCVGANEVCPICEGGDSPSLVSALTIIDHREFKTKSGLVIPFSRKLFVCKRSTHKMLQTLAAKRGGLAGCTFDVMRSGENSSSVGSMFDFVQKDDPAELAEHFVQKDEKGKTHSLFVPANYEEEIPYLSGEQLRAKGFGAASNPMGSEKPLKENTKSADKKYEEEL